MRSVLGIALILFLALFNTPAAPRVVSGRDAGTSLAFEGRLLDGSDIGWLFPTFGDLDRDGKLDLLVGVNGDKEKGEGRLLVYPNRGTADAPAYPTAYWLDDVVPTARIPCG